MINNIQNIFPSFHHIVHRLCTQEWEIKKEIINHNNIIIIYDGIGIFECNNTKVTAQKGDIIYFKPGDMRTGITIQDNLIKCYSVVFNYTCLDYKNNIWNQETHPFPLNFYQHIDNIDLFNNYINIFDSMTGYWIKNNFNDNAIIRGKFLEFINLLIEFKSKKNVDYTKTILVNNVIDYMLKNFDKPLTLKTLTKQANISPTYLNLLFKEVTEKTPMEYFISIKINKARQFLSEGASVTETAYLSGYNDIYYFSKYFKKYSGITPSLYKTQIALQN